jgi:hypothetical protein
MFGLLLRALAIVFVGLTLTACGTRPKPLPEVQQIYEIRDVAVTANAGISPALLRGIQTRLDKAIHDTVRPVPLPRAVMNIHVVGMTRTPGYDGVRTETEVSVALTDVPSGQALVVRNFLVYSFSINARDANESAAEAIASRLRVEYALTQPAIRKQPVASARLSTRMNDDTLIPLDAGEERPLVIPLRTAPVIGADQDPILNSKTKIVPEKQDAAIPAKDAAVTDAKPKTDDRVPANAIENGAAVKVVIKPRTTEPKVTESQVSQPAADEPCVETMDKKC